MDGWNPPDDLTNEFNASIENDKENKKSESSSQNQNTTTVTAAEKKKLESEREEPVFEPHLAMDGEDANHVRVQVAQDREGRINHIRERLESSSQKLRENFPKRDKRPFKPTDDFNRASRGRK